MTRINTLDPADWCSWHHLWRIMRKALWQQFCNNVHRSTNIWINMNKANVHSIDWLAQNFLLNSWELSPGHRTWEIWNGSIPAACCIKSMMVPLSASIPLQSPAPQCASLAFWPQSQYALSWCLVRELIWKCLYLKICGTNGHNVTVLMPNVCCNAIVLSHPDTLWTERCLHGSVVSYQCLCKYHLVMNVS